jgi:nucleotide-binding universal stress UspA family protein
MCKKPWIRRSPRPTGLRPRRMCRTEVAYGHPSQVLVEKSKTADLLVVGNRGHGAFTGMLVGSVSIHCVTNAVCPVVVVRGH